MRVTILLMLIIGGANVSYQIGYKAAPILIKQGIKPIGLRR